MLLFLATMVLCSCGSKSSEAGKAPVRQYTLHGEVVSLDPQVHTAKIKHEKIEGWMEAMTMEYPIKNAADFQTLHPGDCVTASVFVQDVSFWIGEIRHDTAPPAGCLSGPSK